MMRAASNVRRPVYLQLPIHWNVNCQLSNDTADNNQGLFPYNSDQSSRPRPQTPNHRGRGRGREKTSRPSRPRSRPQPWVAGLLILQYWKYCNIIGNTFLSIASILPILFVIWYCCRYCNIFFLLCIAIQMVILFIFFFHSQHTRSTWHCINMNTVECLHISSLSSRQMTDTTDSSVTAEVDSYLLDKSCELSSINHYPHLKRLYVSLKTTLPASAAVERLFSLGSRVFTPLRSRVSSEHFEMMLFLRLAKW